MILGVSHIVLGSAALAQDISFLERLGYKTDFIAHRLATAPEKCCFMLEESPAQDMAFCLPPQGLPIELIHYGSLPDHGRSPWNLISTSAPTVSDPSASTPQSIWNEAWRASGKGPLQSTYLPQFKTHWNWDPNLTASCVLWEVPDLAISRRFFEEGLSGKILHTENNWLMASIAAAVPRWKLDFFLIENRALQSKICLDGAGFRCLSFLSSNLAVDCERIMKSGATKRSGTFELEVNGKLLRLEMIQSPSGALIELMQILKK